MSSSNTPLLPRSNLDEFGQVLELIEYVSETFPLQTDTKTLDEYVFAFMLYNYTDIVGEILDAKMRKIFQADPRLTYAIATGFDSGVPEDLALVTVGWPDKKYRTKRATPVYLNIKGLAGFNDPDALVGAPRPLNGFVDVSAMVRRLEFALRPVIAYQVVPKAGNPAVLGKYWKTGSKPWIQKKP